MVPWLYWSDIGRDTKIVAGGVGGEGDGGESGGGGDWLETSRGRSRVTQLLVLIVRKTCAVGTHFIFQLFNIFNNMQCPQGHNQHQNI